MKINTCYSVVISLIILPFIFISCDDSNDNLGKQKEMRLLRQYLDSKNISVEPESSGLYFISSQEGTGISPEIKDWAIIRYTLKMVNDRFLDTTDEELAISQGIHSTSRLYGDMRLELESINVKGIAEGLMLMREGAKATLIIPSNLAYGSSGTSSIPPYTTLVYDVELVKVIKDPVLYEQQLIAQYIDLYNDSTHLSVEERESNMYYIEILEGAGDSIPEEFNQVSVYYRGTLTDGREFDSNIGGTPFSFIVGENQVVPGFEESVVLMKEGGRSRILLPSSLAYGIEGSGDRVPGYTPLVFDIELLDIQ